MFEELIESGSQAQHPDSENLGIRETATSPAVWRSGSPQPELQALRKTLTATYVRLDPLLHGEGPYVAKWRLQINVSPEGLQAVRST